MTSYSRGPNRATHKVAGRSHVRLTPVNDCPNRVFLILFVAAGAKINFNNITLDILKMGRPVSRHLETDGTRSSKEPKRKRTMAHNYLQQVFKTIIRRIVTLSSTYPPRT